MIYILYLLILILFVFFIIKISIEIKYEDGFYLNIKIYILKYVNILNKNIDLNKEKIVKYKEETQKLYSKFFKEIRIESFIEILKNMKVKIKTAEFELIFDTKDYILNTVITNFFNITIPIIFNIYKIKDIYYNISIEKTTYFKFKCINYIKITNIISVIIKLIYLKIKRRLYGKSTSNRKFDGNSNVFVRNNG
jgi:hypothetical protein